MTDDGPFEFPCAFPVKVFGQNDGTFRTHVSAIIASHFGDLGPEQISENVSRNGRFVSITFTVEAQDRSSLDDVYQALSGDSQILMAL